jgi:FAD/FMN-containing dehydrogenase
MMEKIAQIVGKPNVKSDPKTLEQYSQDISFVNKVKPKLVVKLRNADEAMAIVKLAGENKIPLVPVSSGAPHFKGDTVPSTGGAVILDLSGMKKIIRVDRFNRSVMFEPGVTFGELIQAVADEGMRLNMPLRPRATKSVVGSILEREPVILPKYHWDAADPLNCVEIVFGNGDLFRTGAAAGPGNLQQQWKAGGAQVEAAGPSSASWYRIIQGSQGSMGVVTWASVRCEILPKLEEPFLMGSPDINKILEMAHWLVRLRIANECFILNNVALAALMSPIAKQYQAIKSTLPAWILFYNIAGFDYFPEDAISIHKADTLDIAQKMNLEPVNTLGKVSAFQVLDTARAPSDEPYWKLRYKGACEDVFFLSNYQSVAGLLETGCAAAVNAGYSQTDLGIYIQPAVQGSNYHCEFNLFYDPRDSRESGLIEKASAEMITRLMSGGAFFSRPYGKTAAAIMNRDAASVAMLQKVKNILDPERIMNPGKLCF